MRGAKLLEAQLPALAEKRGRRKLTTRIIFSVQALRIQFDNRSVIHNLSSTWVPFHEIQDESQMETLSMSNSENQQIVLASRPIGAPTPDNFRFETQPIPAPVQGQMLLRTIYLSLDPYMRGRMSEAPSYAPPVAIGDVMVGSTVSQVEISHHPDFAAGDMVLSQSGWQDYAVSDGKGVFRLGAQMKHPSYALGVLGMPGFTAYMGLLEIGQPVAGETVVVAAATGAGGSVVGLIA